LMKQPTSAFDGWFISGMLAPNLLSFSSSDLPPPSRVLPVMMLVYITQNLDKSAIATASIMGMQKDTVSFSPYGVSVVFPSHSYVFYRAWLDKITLSPQPPSGSV
jgi:cell shape-determining protein MreD